jgi:hypothetical protein
VSYKEKKALETTKKKHQHGRIMDEMALTLSLSLVPLGFNVSTDLSALAQF